MKNEKKRNKFIISIVSLLFVGLIILILLLTRQMTLPFLYNSKGGQTWTLGYVLSDSPLEIDYDSIQWIANNTFNPIPSCIMADPFVIDVKGAKYIFYEEMSGKRNSTYGNIAVLESQDGIKWSRLGFALQTKYHLSWPYVFKYNNDYYMMPERTATGELAIYKAYDFPLKWKKEKVIFSNIQYTDPMFYFQDSICYLFVEMNKQLHLFYSHSLLTDRWIEHSQSPISKQPYSRMAGEVKEIDSKLYLFLQESLGSYGTGVHAFEIQTLDTVSFTMQKISKPVLWKNGNSYSKDGMHTLNFVQMNDNRYFIVVDGTKKIDSTTWQWSWENTPDFNWFWKQCN